MDVVPVRVAEQLLALSSGLSYQWLVAPDMPLQAVATDLQNTLVRWLAP